MHPTFLHGTLGVGKRTVAIQLFMKPEYPCLRFHYSPALLGRVFGYGSCAFNALDHQSCKQIIERTMQQHWDGLIAYCTCEPSFPVDDFGRYIKAPQKSGGIGLTCDTSDLEERVESPERERMNEVTDFEALEEPMNAGVFDLPELPPLQSPSTPPADLRRSPCKKTLRCSTMT